MKMIISLSSLLTLSIGILVIITHQKYFGSTEHLPGWSNNNNNNKNDVLQEVDNSENCPCIPRDDCPRMYGQSAVDIRELGFIKPCQEFGTVRCCGVTIRIVQNGQKDENSETENDKIKYDSIENMDLDLEVGESTINSKIVQPPPPVTKLSSLRRAALGRRPSSPLLNKSVMTSEEENDQRNHELKEGVSTNSALESPSDINSSSNITETFVSVDGDNSTGPWESDIGLQDTGNVRQGARILTNGDGSSNLHRVRPPVLPWRGLSKEKSVTNKSKLSLKLPPASPVYSSLPQLSSSNLRKSNIELNETTNLVRTALLSSSQHHNQRQVDGGMNVTEINTSSNTRRGPLTKLRHQMNSYPSLPTIRPFVVKKANPQLIRNHYQQQQLQQNGPSGIENVQASMLLKTKIEPAGGLRHVPNRQVSIRNRTREQIHDKLLTSNQSMGPIITSTTNYQIEPLPPIRRLKRPYEKLVENSLQIVETTTTTRSTSGIDKVKSNENNQDVSQTNVSAGLTGTTSLNGDNDNDETNKWSPLLPSLYRQPPHLPGHRRRLKSRIRISTTPSSIHSSTTSILPPSSHPSQTFSGNFNGMTGTGGYTSGNYDEKISSQLVNTFIIPSSSSSSSPTQTQVIAETITDVPSGPSGDSFSTTSTYAYAESVPIDSYMIESIRESDVVNTEDYTFTKNSMDDHKSLYPPLSPTTSMITEGAGVGIGGERDSSVEMEPMPTPTSSPPSLTSERVGVIKVLKNTHPTRSRPTTSMKESESSVLKSTPVQTISQYSRIRMTKTNAESKKGTGLGEQSGLMSSNSSLGSGASRRFTIPSHIFNTGSGGVSQGIGMVVNGNENPQDDKEPHSISSLDIQSGMPLRTRSRESQKQPSSQDNYDLILDKEKRKFMQIPQHHQHQHRLDHKNFHSNPSSSNVYSQSVRSSSLSNSHRNPSTDIKVNAADSTENSQRYHHTFDRVESSRYPEPSISTTDIHEESRIHQTFIRHADATHDIQQQDKKQTYPHSKYSSNKEGIGSSQSQSQSTTTRTVSSYSRTPTPSAEPFRKRLRQRVKSPTFPTTTQPTTTTAEPTESQPEPVPVEQFFDPANVNTMTSSFNQPVPSTTKDEDFVTVIQFNSTHHHLEEPQGTRFLQTTTTPKSTFVFPAFKQEKKTVTPTTMSYLYPESNPPLESHENSYINNNGNNFQTETHSSSDGNSHISSSGWIVSSSMKETESNNPVSLNRQVQEQKHEKVPQQEFTSQRFPSQRNQNQNGDEMTYNGAQPSTVRFPVHGNNKGDESASSNRAQVPDIRLEVGGGTMSNYHIYPDRGHSTEKFNLNSNSVHVSSSTGSQQGTTISSASFPTLASQPTMTQVLNLEHSQTQSQTQRPTTMDNIERVNLRNDNRPLGFLRPKPRVNNTRFSVPKTFTLPTFSTSTTTSSKLIVEDNHKNNSSNGGNVVNEYFHRGNSGTRTNGRLNGVGTSPPLPQKLSTETLALPTFTGNRLVVAEGNPSKANSQENPTRVQHQHQPQLHPQPQPHHPGYSSYQEKEVSNTQHNYYNKEIPSTAGGFSFHLETPPGGKKHEINTIQILNGGQPPQQQQYKELSREPTSSLAALNKQAQYQHQHKFVQSPSLAPAVVASSTQNQNPNFGIHDTKRPLQHYNSPYNTMTTFKDFDKESNQQQQKSPSVSNVLTSPPSHPMTMTQNEISSISLTPPQPESYTSGSPGFSISFSTLPDGIKVHETNPFLLKPLQVATHYQSSPAVTVPAPPSTTSYARPGHQSHPMKMSPGPPPTMAHIKESDFIPQHDPTLPTAPPSTFVQSPMAPMAYTQHSSNQHGYPSHSQYENQHSGYSFQQPLAQSSNSQMSRYPMGSTSSKQLQPTRLQTQNMINYSPPMRLPEQSSLSISKPTHYSRPTQFQQQQTYKPQVEFNGRKPERDNLPPFHHQVDASHLSIPENIIHQLKSSLRNSRATNFSDIPPMDSNVITTIEQVEQESSMDKEGTVGKSQPTQLFENKNGTNLNSTGNDFSFSEMVHTQITKNVNNESQVVQVNGTKRMGENFFEMKLNTPLEQEKDDANDIKLMAAQPIKNSQDGDNIAENANIVIAELMDDESEKQSRSIGFKDPQVIQGGFIPILPYSEEDPGPVFVKMQSSFS